MIFSIINSIAIVLLKNIIKRMMFTFHLDHIKKHVPTI